MRHLDLFSGIGGFAHAAQQVWGKEYECVGFCEIDPFCQAVLKKHWKGATIYGDIRGLTKLSIFDKINLCKTDQINIATPLSSTTEDYRSATSPSIIQSHDKLCGKSSSDEVVASVPISNMESQTIFTGGQEQATTHKIFSKKQLKKELLKKKPIAENVEIAGYLRTVDQKSKHTTQTIPNHLMLNGSAKNVITTGIEQTGRQEASNEATASEDRKIDLLTGGFP